MNEITKKELQHALNVIKANETHVDSGIALNVIKRYLNESVKWGDSA